MVAHFFFFVFTYFSNDEVVAVRTARDPRPAQRLCEDNAGLTFKRRLCAYAGPSPMFLVKKNYFLLTDSANHSIWLSLLGIKERF